jgi:FkbM family methyltransferase
MILRLLAKLRRDGPAVTFKTALKIVNYRMFQPDWDFKIVPDLLEDFVQSHNSIAIVQIGANVGDTGSDQIYGFLKKWCLNRQNDSALTCRAILIEPVRHLFEQLRENYHGFSGVECENVAIADRACTRKFYRLRSGIDLVANGLVPFAEQLGSFLPEQMDSLWSHDPANQKLREFVKANTVAEDVVCLSIHDIISKHHLEKIDLLQVDTEGYDYEIIRTIDFKHLAPACINYERIHLKNSEAACRRLLVRNNYQLRDHGQDTLALHSSGLSPLYRFREAIYCLWLDLVY